MKPKLFILLAALSIMGFSASAQKTSVKEPVTKSIHLEEKFTSLIIDNDIAVELTEANSDEIVVEGEESKLRRFRAQVEDGKLILSCVQASEKSAIKVFVPATLLNKITINGKSELTSASVLSNPSIRVIIDGESKVHLRSVGKVKVEGTADYDFIKLMR